MERALIVSTAALWILLLLNILVTLALVRRLNAASRPNTDGQLRPTDSRYKGLIPGQQAPDFTAETLRGESVTLASFAGSTVAFLFVGTHCQPCRDAIPSFERTQSRAAQAGVELVLVSIDNAVQTRVFAEEVATSMRILVAPREENPFMSDYKTSITPSYCLIDQRGKVKSSGYPVIEQGEWTGWMDSEEARKPRLPILAPGHGDD